jgi:cobyrinic acid a,c-diamide synthase
MKAIVVAGTASGVGKTTVAVGLIAALARRGLAVQPFKVGPDYIDPTYHGLAAGRPSRNLDSWLVPPDVLRALFARATGGSDVAVIEGVMGLYDGKSGGGEAGSTAEAAKLLGAPVLLVVDAAKTARSAAAVALGFRELDSGVQIAGVILNRIASPTHYAAAAEPIEREAGLPVLGWLPRNADWQLEERYLGLVPTTERAVESRLVDRLADGVEAGVDLEALLDATSAPPQSASNVPGLFPPEPLRRKVRIAVARDEAFGFYYQDNLDLLSAWGAELVPFSPRRDERLPDRAAGLYIAGGFPELFAAELSANATLLAAVRQAAAQGMPLYAECGGLMYLCEGLVDAEGRRHPMAGAIPGWTSLRNTRLTVGYRTVRARRDSPLLGQGETVRGHEFHWSVSDPRGDNAAAYDVVDSNGQTEGHARGNMLASYVHLHFGADLRLAPRFVEACERWEERSGKGIRDQPMTALPGYVCHPERSEGSHVDHRESEQPAVLGGPDSPGPLLRRHGLPPAEIERLSLGRIAERLNGSCSGGEPERSLVARLVYASGDPDLGELVEIAPTAIEAAVRALRLGATVVVDVGMVAAGLDRARLRALGCAVRVAVDEGGAAELAGRHGITRTAAGLLSLAECLADALVAVGNAPTALLALLDLVAEGRARPAAVIGTPVGFVAAAESKEALRASDLPYVTVRGTRGGSPIAAATVNHLLRMATREASTGAGSTAPVR